MFLLSIRRAALLQAGLVALAALVGSYWLGAATGKAMLYGGLAALINTGLLYWRWARDARNFHSDPARHLKGFYRSSLERFFVVGIWLALGFAWVNLPPLAMLTGFVTGQLAWVIASMALRERD